MCFGDTSFAASVPWGLFWGFLVVWCGVLVLSGFAAGFLLPGWVRVSSLRALGCLCNTTIAFELFVASGSSSSSFGFARFSCSLVFELRLFSWPSAPFGFHVALTVQKFLKFGSTEIVVYCT